MAILDTEQAADSADSCPAAEQHLVDPCFFKTFDQYCQEGFIHLLNFLEDEEAKIFWKLEDVAFIGASVRCPWGFETIKRRASVCRWSCWRPRWRQGPQSPKAFHLAVHWPPLQECAKPSKPDLVASRGWQGHPTVLSFKRLKLDLY